MEQAATRFAYARQAAAGALPKTGRRWKRKDGGQTLWLVCRLSLFVSASRICAGVFALRICMQVDGLGRRMLLLPYFLATCRGWHLGNLRVGVQPHRPLSLFLVEEGHAREELSFGSSHPCVPGTRFLWYALTDLVPPGGCFA